MPLAIGEAERVLRRMLRDHGVDPSEPGPPGRVWPVFGEFALIPSEASGPDADGVLYESGDFSFLGAEEFYLSFTRQFEVLSEDGEHDHYEQLRCEFRFPMTDETASLRRFSAWWFVSDDAPWSEFAAMVEARPEFVALRGIIAISARLEQESV